MPIFASILTWCKPNMPKISVIIPCMNREEMLRTTLPAWQKQHYENKEIVIIDYSSNRNIFSLVQQIVPTVSYNHVDGPFSLLRIDNQSFFNMAHAVNIGSKNSTGDIIAIVGTESLPVPHYLNIIANTVNDTTFTRCLRGRLSLTRNMINSINGFPELCEYWGAEDDIVAYQLRNLQYKLLDLDYLLVHNISHYYYWGCLPYYQKYNQNAYRNNIIFSNENRTIKNLDEGANINIYRYLKYCEKYNPSINNYGKEYGTVTPILAEDLTIPDHLDILPELRESFNPKPEERHFGKRCNILLLDKNISLDVFKLWNNQTYLNKRIFMPPNEEIKEYCDKNHISDVVFLDYNRLSEVDFGELEVVCLCENSEPPAPYLLDIAMNLLEDNLLFNADKTILFGQRKNITDAMMDNPANRTIEA